jgi:citrate/tricarballylate utilization protein
MPEPDVFAEAQRQFTICNACRYCEGYCAVFPAMELRRELTRGDAVFLAHLCHDCRACYYACMYTPPHEFAVNVPRALAQVRMATYERYAWPGMLGRLVREARLSAVVAAGAVLVVAALVFLTAGPARLFTPHRGPGAFYEVISYEVTVISGLAIALYVAAVWASGGVRFWREAGPLPRGSLSLRTLAAAMWEAATLRWLRGGGPGCPYPEERPSSRRRVLHGLVFYGFLAAVASTTLAAIYQDLLHRLPPYPLTSAPVVLGTLGGVAMIVGSAGLVQLKAGSDPSPADGAAVTLDYSFLIILGLAAVTGMLTLVLRGTAAMGTALTIHLGLVAALYVTAPYGKFVHAVYRCVALLRNHVEQREARPPVHLP